jgi:hypothetical protein
MLYPGDSPPGRPTVDLTRDEFLALPTLKAFGETFTVRELIKFSADRLGAVHFIPPKGSKEEALWDFMRGSHVTGPRGQYSLGMYDLAAVGKIVLDSVAGLRMCVEREMSRPLHLRVGSFSEQPTDSQEPTDSDL